MSQFHPDNVTESPGAMTPTSPHAELLSLPFEQPPKLKGRRRLLQTLQRISSSPSLARVSRVPHSSYRGGGRGSMSCVSLSSSAVIHGHSYGNSCSSHSSAGFSTAPTSVASTPSPESQSFDPKVRIRIIENEPNSHFSMATSVALPADLRSVPKDTPLAAAHDVTESREDCFPRNKKRIVERRRREQFDFWGELPHEIKVQIFRFLKPKEIIRCSAVSKIWQKMCFDGQLWINVDTEEYYRDIPSKSLVKIMTAAGPFVRDLNLRGCVQMRDRWGSDGQRISDACRNLEYFSLEDCRIDRSSVHCFLLRNPRLVHINVSGLPAVNNLAMKIIAQGCQQLEFLNVSWCANIDTRGLQKIVRACPKLKDLRASEIRGFDDKEFLNDLFVRNTLERLIASRCNDLDDDSMGVLFQGIEPKFDTLTDRVIAPPRKFRHLDFSRCGAFSDRGAQYIAHAVPYLSGLQLSQCDRLTDNALAGILESTPLLTHLDLEELENLSNTTLQTLSRSPCAPVLQHLNLSYCESLGDAGMLPVLKSCSGLRNLVMDNTRISDLALTEAAAQLCTGDRAIPSSPPRIGLHLVVYDCQNVTWSGVREVLSRNTDPQRGQIISLKCFYGYQDTVNEHTKRVLRGDKAAAIRLERKWGEYMVASEEAGAGGAGARRRRRRLREAALIHADEEEGGPRGGRRRARSGGCTIM